MSGIESGRIAFGRRSLRAHLAARQLNPGSHRSLGRLALFVAIVSCTLSGCAALSPQMFSDRLSPPRPPAGTPPEEKTESTAPTVRQARADIESVQKKYADAIQDLSNITPRTSAALIGLSATALYKGLTGGSTKGIAALGVLGSGVWAYGATMTSQPRQRVYGEGIRALSCALTAASPYDRDSTWTGQLETEIQTAATESEHLRDWQETYAYLLEPQTIPGKKPTVSAACTGKRPDPCPKGTPGSASGEQALAECQARIAKSAKDCVRTGGTPDTIVGPPSKLTAAFQRARDEQARIALAVSNARNLRGVLDVTGQTLMDRSTDIQVKVSGEVLKTEPDPTAVLATLKNLKQVAVLVAGASLTAPTKPEVPTGGAQGAALEQPERAALQSRRDAEIDNAIRDLNQRLDKSYAARVKLESRLAEVDGAVRKVNRTLDQCEYTAPGGSALVVSPSATSIQLPLGSSQSFTVSGGSGVPLGSVNAVAGAKLGGFPEPKIDRGTFNFTYTAPAEGQIGDQVIVLFTDASHQGTHEVTLTAVAAAPANPKPDQGVTPPAGGKPQPRPEDVPPPVPPK